MSTSCSTTLNNTDPLKQVQDLKTLRMDYNKYFKQAVPEEYEFDDVWIRKQVCLKKHRLLYAKYYGKTLVGRWANDIAWMRSKIIKAKKEKDAPRPRITTDKDLPGWTIRSVIRKHGKLAGQTYRMYYSPSGQRYRSRVQALRVLQAEQDHAEALMDNADEGRNTRKRKHSDMMQDTRTSEHDLSKQTLKQSGESKDCCDEDVEDSDETLTDIDVPEDDTDNNNGAPMAMDQMPMTYEEMKRKLHKDFREANVKYEDFILAECLKVQKLELERYRQMHAEQQQRQQEQEAERLRQEEAARAETQAAEAERQRLAEEKLEAQRLELERQRQELAEQHRPDIAKKLDLVHAAHLMLSTSREMAAGMTELLAQLGAEGQFQLCRQQQELGECGPVTLANALLLTHGIRVEPKRLLDIARRIGIITSGTSGVHLKALSRIALYVVGARPLQQVTIRSVWDLKPGDILLVNGVSLKNAHSKLHNKCNFEEASGNHFVMVEEVQKTHLTVINPDTRPCDEGCLYDASKPCTCYKDGIWGRMTLTICDMTRLMGLNRPTGATAAVLRFYCSYR